MPLAVVWALILSGLTLMPTPLVANTARSPLTSRNSSSRGTFENCNENEEEKWG